MTIRDEAPPYAWLDKPVAFLTHWNIEKTLVVLILVMAVLSRFYHVDLRVMSHDEVNHVVPAWELYQGRGYSYDPVTHGPLQFHLIALSYFLLGDSDFSARVPAVLFSIATVAAVTILFRRYLGRVGALIAGVLFLISPYLLYYGRYTRNEAFIGLFGVLTLYGILRYLDKGDSFSLYLLTIVTALHFTDKATSYIFSAQLLLFVGLLLLDGLVRARWESAAARNRFLFLMAGALLSIGVALGLATWNANLQGAAANQGEVNTLTPQLAGEVVALLIALGAGLLGMITLVRSLGWQVIRSQRSFDILLLIGTLIMPTLSALPVKMLGWNPLDYTSTGMLRSGIFIIVLTGIAVGLGLWWRGRFWLFYAAIFYAIFITLFTTFFTNGRGFFTGLVGALGYWVSQQGVQRGGQPWYYYWLIQIPIYEYLAALGTIVAVYFGVRFRRLATFAGFSPAAQPDATDESDSPVKVPTLTLLLYWTVTSLVAFTLAGEKMPWLTLHIAVPMLLSAGWGLGYLVETTPWKKAVNQSGFVAVLLLPVLLTALASTLGSLLGDTPPFQGSSLDQLQATSLFMQALVVTGLSGLGIGYLLRGWSLGEALRLCGVVFFTLLAVLTVRTSIRASYIDYDYATEYLVYAHAASGPKEVLSQVEEISRRTTGGLDIAIAYDNDALYPYWWYLRDYPNHRWFTDKPTRDLQEVPLIISGDSTAGKMQPIVQDRYIEFETMRLWWPNQDYYNLTWQRIWDAVSNPKMRAAIFKIWLNRDYSLYATLTNNPNLKPETWQPSSKMRFYIRKDVAAKIWNYGVAPAAQELTMTDPYEAAITAMEPDLVIGGSGSEPGLFASPRGLAAAPDGSIYVVDSRNHRVQRFSADGELMSTWGRYADATQPNSDAPGGTFNEPWGIAVAADGSVYVADTWNYRIQKFNANGEFVTMWGFLGTAESGNAFWGPRDVAVDSQGRVYVSDTGNKRMAIFSPSGEYITHFGSAGVELGQFDEPVGIAIDLLDNLFVVDTWNERVQGFSPTGDDLSFVPFTSWEIYGWFGLSLENKPYLAIAPDGSVLVTAPESSRVLQFGSNGEFLRGWSEYSAGAVNLSIYNGVAVDAQGRVWVSDAGNHRLLRFSLP